MNTYRIALANIRFPKSREESVTLAEEAIAEASTERADVICFPECFVPGYRGMNKEVLPPDPVFLERAWSNIASAAASAKVAVILGTERVVADAVLASALVINRDGTMAGFQDKVQLDPSESATTSAVVQPDGTLLVHQPYGKEGLLVADINITLATGFLASRYKPVEMC
ncbi:MAG TPA: nitrilase-related carbon-nitrogen hydrolase [Pyrinomonadaceae bacterium]|nr:nitrilase-related carbon-nitrogen hydrolase [Pyrinomonadaceae bacterium]